MCLDPSFIGEILSEILSVIPLYPMAVGILIGLVLTILVNYFESRHDKQHRSRSLRRYREDVYQLRQEAAQERKIAADECLQDLYRLTTRKRETEWQPNKANTR